HLNVSFSLGSDSFHHFTNSSCSAGSSTAEPPKDELLGGLMSVAFDGASCLSRHQSAWYRRKPSNHTPSPYLIRRLRRYEALHKKCGPNTKLYRKAVEQLVSGTSTAAAECNYVVWVPSDGLGNRIISIASAFLYALLNDKVLLLHRTDDMGDLFCEPFPETSWVLPSDFPVSSDMDTANASLPASNQYFAPAFFLVPELGIQIRLFRRAHFDSHSDYIIDCALTKRLLPNKLRSMYYEHATTTGEVISVHQPSHEEEQHSEKLNHNMKAFAEIYLLSLSDALITSPFSTFGYVAQGLGGLRPWLLVRPDDHDLCLHSTSMEPCFHFPPSYDCKARKKVDIGSVAPYLRHCEDFPHGVRLFD
ncbi:Xyloglucan fucosyltransferase, partial [Musa troglodytarum]